MHVFWLLGAYAGGLLLANAWLFPVPLSLCIPGLGLLVAWLRLRRSRWGQVPALGIFMLLGFVWASDARLPPRDHDHVSRFADEKPVVIEGTLQHQAVYSDGRSRFDLAVTKIIRGASAAPASGLVRVMVKQGTLRAGEGQTLRLRCRLRVPRNFGSPGEFDYAGHLASQDIFVTTYLTEAAQALVMTGNVRERASSLADFRRQVATRISLAVPAAEAGLVQALVVGMREGIDPRQRKVLSEGGVAHLFAISGLHFGLLSLLLYAGCRWLYCRSTKLLLFCPPRRNLPLLLIVPMAGYLFLTGNGLATRRAFLMTTAASLLYSSNRRTAPLPLLAAAALAILLFEPLALFRPAFQLSFAGLFGILLWLPVWQKLLNGSPPWLRCPALLFLTTLAATMATAPLTLWHFHTFAPAGLLANLAATPVIAWGAVPAGLAGVLLTALAPQTADTCFAFAGFLVANALQLVDWLTGWPGLAALRYFPSHRDLLAITALLAALSLRGRQASRWLQRLGLLAIALILWLPAAGDPGRLRVVAISVGQGDATLVSFDAQRHYLIDGAGLPQSSYDPGERLLAPALGRLRVNALQGIILTHDHPDHYEGLLFILKHFPVEKFYGGMPLEQLNPALHAVITEHNLAYEPLDPGWTELISGKPERLKVFVPDQRHHDINERSLAVYTSTGQDGVLLTGDMGPASLRQMLAAGLPGPCTLLKLPHHGSRRSLPAEYLPTIAPQIAFVSAGRHNPHHLPHAEAISLCKEMGVPLYRTDRQGSLVFSSNGLGWSATIHNQGFSIDAD